jgi:crotonobetainyl-CoA:carnitine CoA-transferase CaiB-like acyl-CoA transferase
LPPPLLGEHTADVLGGILGMASRDIERLRKEGLI